MKIKELNNKGKGELQKLFQEFCQKRQDLEFKIANKQVTNVRELRDVKKTIARLLTLLNKVK
jgi:ribosomal protein L29